MSLPSLFFITSYIALLSKGNMSGDASPSCWICLEEGPDQLGKPIVRDCSCRGDAGFAHLSCLKEYAKRASIELNTDRLIDSEELRNSAASEVKKFTVAWQKCPFCHQRYEHELAIELVNSLLLFIEEKNPHTGSTDNKLYLFRYMDALSMKIDAIRSMDPIHGKHKNPELIVEGKRTAYKLLSVAQQMKMEGSQILVALPHVYVGDYEIESKDSYKEGLKHYRKARNIYKSIGDTANEKLMETKIATTKSVYEGNRATHKSEAGLENDRDMYEHYAKREGEHSLNALNNGIKLVNTLHRLGHNIEGERLVSKIAPMSVRIYGPEHDISKWAVRVLKILKQRPVSVQPQGGIFYNLPCEADGTVVQPQGGISKGGFFNALRCEADGDKYVLGWLLGKDASGNDKEPNSETFTVASKDVVFYHGVPVVCHGLKNAAHLNGKMGDSREYNSDTGRYCVYFEDKSLAPVRVKGDNLRIVFELPAPAEEKESSEEASTDAGAQAETREGATSKEATGALLLAEIERRSGRNSAVYLLAAAANAKLQAEWAEEAAKEAEEETATATDDARADEAAAALLAELDLEETEARDSDKRKGKKKKKGKKNRKK